MPGVDKPILNIDGQIAHMHSKGIKFTITPEDDARSYLENHTYYFKLHAYTMNYPKHPDGINKGKYINLEFAYLQDLAIIDMRLRYLLLQMALDIEHHAKVKLLHAIEHSTEDGYDIVNRYRDTRDCCAKKRLQDELTRNKRNPFCEYIFTEYDQDYPAWAFIEIVSLGTFEKFCEFCAEKLGDDDLHEAHSLLSAISKLRNAAAHSNCLLNDLHTVPKGKRSTLAPLEKTIVNDLDCHGITREVRGNKMSNKRVRAVVAILYAYRELISSDGLRNERIKNLHELISERMFRNREYYADNRTIMTTFNFLKNVVDKWFPSA